MTGPVVAVVQARTGATRLPNKVLLDLAGEPMLARVLARVARIPSVDGFVVATTSEPRDDPVAGMCRERGWPHIRGSESDLLDRYRLAARHAKAETVVRITADCPLLSPAVSDRVVRAFLDARPRPDYASNTIEPRTYPQGLDTEVFSAAALERAWKEDTNPAWREHVTPYFYRNPEKFRLLRVANDVDHSGLRWTVDTPEDLEFARRVYGAFHDDGFEWTDVLDLLRRHPEWTEINRSIKQKRVP